MLKQKIQSFFYGFSKFKTLLVLTSVFLFCSVAFVFKKKPNTTLTFYDIGKDTVQISSKKPLLFIVMKEPSCTGCKANLIEHIDKNLTRKYKVNFLIISSQNISNKRIYQSNLENSSKKRKKILYSLDDKNAVFLYQNQKQEMISTGYPFVITAIGNQLNCYTYSQIFNDMDLKKSFIDSL
jgi:hypothetical protein